LSKKIQTIFLFSYTKLWHLKNKLLKFNGLEFKSIKSKFNSSCIAMLFTFQFHRKALVSLASRTLHLFFLFHTDLLLLLFPMLLILMQIRKIYYMLHIASHHYYPLAKIHLYQNYFNVSCYWYMNMCCLIKLHVTMLTLFKRLLIEN